MIVNNGRFYQRFNGGRVVIPTWFSSIAIFTTLIGGVLVAEDRFNQADDVLSVSETVGLHNYQEHKYHYQDISDRVVHLSGIENRNSDQERELVMYQNRKDKVQITLERLGKE